MPARCCAGLLALFAGWSLLVVVSTLTTWQHHFIDLPTGLLLGLLCLWLWPANGGVRARWQLTHDKHRLALAARYLIGAVALAVIAAWLGGVGLWLIWPALSLAAVALAYLALGPDLAPPSSTTAGSSWRRERCWRPTSSPPGSTRGSGPEDARSVAVADGVSFGCFPPAADCTAVSTVIDLTAELSRPRTAVRWISLPTLDLVTPKPATLYRIADAIEAARHDGPVLVCCALGYGRSAAAVAIWLVRTGRAANLDAALLHLRAKQPRLVVTAEAIGA